MTIINLILDVVILVGGWNVNIPALLICDHVSFETSKEMDSS